MARADTLTKLPLDHFFLHMGINPLHGNQVYLNTPDGSTMMCGQPFDQHAWQRQDAIGREEMAQAILQAETDIERWLGYNLRPDWTVNEQINTDRAINQAVGVGNLFGGYGGSYAGWGGAGSGPYGLPKTIRLNRGYYLMGGKISSTLVEAHAAITYSDADSDGYDETATIVVTVPTDSLNYEIRVFYPDVDGELTWEIRPLKSIVIDEATWIATITFRREQCVKPELMEGMYPEGVDGSIDANFLDEVDVYRIKNNPAEQAQLIWAPNGYNCSSCGGSGCGSCNLGIQSACIVANDPRLAIIHYSPADWDADDEHFHGTSLYSSRVPDRLNLWYYSGWQLKSLPMPTIQMDPYWEMAVTFLAASYLDRKMCGCDSLESFSQKWREDLAFSNERGSYQIGQRNLSNPIGTSRGAINAWKCITQPGRQLPEAPAG